MIRSNNHHYILLLTTVAAIAGLLFGFDFGVINGALELIVKTFHIIAQKSNTYSVFGLFTVNGITLKEFIVSALPAGAFLGALLGSKITHLIGRRGALMITAILFLVGALIAAMSSSFNILLLARIIMGFAVGLSAMVVPVYLSELSPPDMRGSLIFFYQMAITVGILFAFIINYLFLAYANWRAMFAISVIPSLMLGWGMFLLPESPRWLALHGKHTRAHNALHKLRGHKHIKEEITGILNSISNSQGGFRLLLSKRFRKLLFVTLGLFMFQQFTGINTIFYYAPTLFESAGFQGYSVGMLAMIATGAINVFATILGIWFVDHIGRRKLLYIGFIGIIICQLIMGGAYSQFFGEDIRWVCLTTSLLFISFFAISISGITYIIMAEIFPLNIRSHGVALASCAYWGFNMLVASSFLTLVNYFGFANTYWLYALFTAIGLVFVIALIPETKKVPLEHIEKNFYAGLKIRELGRL